MSDVWMLTIMGILIVFSILTVLFFVIMSFKLFFRTNKTKKKQQNIPLKEPVEPLKLKKIKSKELDLTEEELVAVVAAISMYFVGKEFEIKSITRMDTLSEKYKKNKLKDYNKTKWKKHNPSVSWIPYRKKRWR